LSRPIATSSLDYSDPNGVNISHNDRSLGDDFFHKKAANDNSYRREPNLCVDTDATATSASGSIIPADFDEHGKGNGVRDSLMLLKTKGRPRSIRSSSPVRTSLNKECEKENEVGKGEMGVFRSPYNSKKQERGYTELAEGEGRGICEDKRGSFICKYLYIHI
jgi:hypothetical protein